MNQLSLEQIRDAGGRYAEAAQGTEIQFNREQSGLPAPTFSEIQIALGIDAAHKEPVRMPASQIATKSEVLKILGGARVMVGIKAGARAAFLPGVILPDSLSTGLRFGCLAANEDVRSPEKTDAERPLSDYQQLLLGKMVATHQPAAARHNGMVNSADPNHALLVAASTTPNGLHDRVHTFVKSGAFSVVAATTMGANDVRLTNRVRKDEPRIFTPDQVSGLVIVEHHQMLWPLEGNAFDVTGAFTLAAVRTQVDHRPQPDLRANVESLQDEVAL